MRLSVLVSPLLRSVKRREAVRAQLRQSDTHRGRAQFAPRSGADTRKHLVQEYKRLTHVVKMAMGRWERQNGVPFMYRGIPYLDDLRGETDADKIALHDQAMKRALRAF